MANFATLIISRGGIGGREEEEDAVPSGRVFMFSAESAKLASGRVIPSTSESSSANSMDAYRILMPRLPSGNVVLNSLFLHADMAARPYRAPDFRDAICSIIDPKDIISLGQYQMSHVWMITCTNALAKAKLASREELIVKGRDVSSSTPKRKTSSVS